MIKLKNYIKKDYLQKKSKIKQISQKNYEIGIKRQAKFNPILKILTPLVLTHFNNNQQRSDILEKDLIRLKSKLDELYLIISNNISNYQKNELIQHISILPLADNMLFSYLQQLLFIPSIRTGYIDMVNIESDISLAKTQREQMIIESAYQLYPVVRDCIQYIMKGGDYPWESRFEFQYSKIHNTD